MSSSSYDLFAVGTKKCCTAPGGHPLYFFRSDSRAYNHIRFFQKDEEWNKIYFWAKKKYVCDDHPVKPQRKLFELV